MKISEHLKESQISLNLTAREKEAAIKELAELLKEAKEITDFNTFLKEVFAREGLTTTGIGKGLALPHARTGAVKEFVIAFGRSPKGVGFDSLDGKPAKLVFLMGTPKNKGLDSYLKLLAHLSRLLRKESFRNALLKAATAEDIIELFRKAEN